MSADDSNPATVGSPDHHDIVVHHNDRVFAYAFYNEVQSSGPRFRRPAGRRPRARPRGVTGVFSLVARRTARLVGMFPRDSRAW